MSFSLSTSKPLLEQTSTKLVPELKLYVQRHRSVIEAMIKGGGPQAGLPAAIRSAKNYDGLLSSLFHAVRAVFEAQRRWIPVCLAAVGSYGRGALAYRSDLDVRLLCKGNLAKAAPIAEALLYPLWDVGLSIGHQVVGVGQLVDLARNDLATATTVLDWRPIAGDQHTSTKLFEKAHKALFCERKIGRFLDKLQTQSLARGDRYGDSIYLLEPDVKNGLGGLRDLDVACWVARARWHIDSLSELVMSGVLSQQEHEQIENASQLLWKVRNLLHLYSGRCMDRLSFERQEQLAQDLGYGSGGAGVEHFMSDYYRHARALSKARELMLSRAEPPPKRRPTERPLDQDLLLINNQYVAFAEPRRLEQDPALCLRLYWAAIKRDLKVHRTARDIISRHTSSPAFCAALRESEEAGRLFARMCCVVQKTQLRDGSPLRELHDVGLLVAMIPEFAPVVGRVHHDVYHVYTVDVHSVAAVDRLRALCRGELSGEYDLASRLAAELARPQVLFFATLLHDVGKDIGGRNHSQRGFELAANILRRIGLAESDIREVQHLVLKHLRMYHVATRRDIDDPKTVQGFCDEVHGPEGLRELYLLTIVDVSTTSPTALTSWKSRMLEDLYVQALRALSEGQLGPSESRAEMARMHVLELCGPQDDIDFVRDYLAAMPGRYLYANDAREVIEHARFARAEQGSPLGFRTFGVDGPYVEVGVVADDRAGLLAMITACFIAAGAKVLGAQIYSYDEQGRTRALDLFWVRIGQRAQSVEQALPRLRADFLSLLNGELSPADLTSGKVTVDRWSARKAPSVPTRVSLDNRASLNHTVIEVITRDQPGLLFWLAHVLQSMGLTISLAKINTEGVQVADVFYVTDEKGAKMSEAGRIEELKRRILSVIAELEEKGTS